MPPSASCSNGCKTAGSQRLSWPSATSKERGGSTVFLKAVPEPNPVALDIARERDVERKRGFVRGPLHDIPFLVKNNIATKDKMQTTAGSTMLIGSEVPGDAHVVKLLREAGAVLLGHANMSEWASMRATYYAVGYLSRGGQNRNPYNLAEHPGDSSSGPATAVASNMCAFSLGTETDSSMILPADRNAVVVAKPRTSTGTKLTEYRRDFTSQILGRDALKRAQFGMPWKRVWERASSNELVRTQYLALHNLVVKRLQDFGAEVINVEIPSASRWCLKMADGIVDFYNDIKKYLAGLVVNPHKFRSLEDVIQFNIKHTEREGGVPGTHPAWPTGQDSFDRSQAVMGVGDETCKSALESIRRKTRDEGIDAALNYDGGLLDGLLVPVQADDDLYRKRKLTDFCTGYPMITILVDVGDDGEPN
ncbi:hypothetical protein O1611_g6163 [Lasiodiplodia mahajangana]|uniref:Uncharacterized protein n=1 Tax=Lasiodiplodia mahajangana TaxID=1108764 RepID=A0ACC2JIY8_9PEZI|nr:hypothetical protein O1611_g6163 [Lasiodiplodia mahajangana]